MPLNPALGPPRRVAGQPTPRRSTASRPRISRARGRRPAPAASAPPPPPSPRGWHRLGPPPPGRPAPARPVPRPRLDPLRLPRGDGLGDGGALHAGDPAPVQASAAPVDRQRQVAPLPPPLHPLPDLHPARRPDPPHLPAQPHPQLVAEGQRGPLGHARGRQRRRQAPLFQASCASRPAWAASGRGTFFLILSRCNTERMPHA